MEFKIREHVEYLFKGAPQSRRALELMEEMIDNLTSKYHDLVDQGETEEAAYGIAIAGIGEVDELIQRLREEEMWGVDRMDYQRQKSAMLVAAAVGLFILSPVCYIICDALSYVMLTLFFETLGYVTTLICVAAGVSLLVYNAKSKPKYVKREETVVDNFKEWNVKKSNKRSLSNTVQSIIWTATVPVYLILGMFFHAWSTGWIVFLLAPVVSQIVRLVLMNTEEE